jgi:energy-coupling factor transporter ATP-binding protein EcfA2
MSLNLDKVGRPLAVVVDGKFHNKIVSVYTEGEDDDKIKKPFNSMKLTDVAKFQQLPNTETEREILYITGASGSGKTTYTCNYIKQYRKAFKKNEIYVFSALKEDESLDVLLPKRVKVDESLVSDPIPVEAFENSLVVFDDIDVIANKKVREEVYKILNAILETGRHFKISCVITNHLPTAGKDTRRVLNECHSITYFPHSGSKRGINYLLEEYIGLDKKDIKKIKKLKTRWATIFKNYPQIAMTEKNIYVLAEEDD